MTQFLKPLVHAHLITTISYKETFLQDFLVVLKRTLQNYEKILRNHVFSTAETMMSSAGILPPVAKGLTFWQQLMIVNEIK